MLGSCWLNFTVLLISSLKHDIVLTFKTILYYLCTNCIQEIIQQPKTSNLDIYAVGEYCVRLEYLLGDWREEQAML